MQRTKNGTDTDVLQRNKSIASIVEEPTAMTFSLRSQMTATTALLAALAFAPGTPGWARSDDAIQKVAEHGTQADAGKTGVGSPGSKVGPSTGATPPASEAGSQPTSTPRSSKVGASDNPGEPINPEHPSPNNQTGRR